MASLRRLLPLLIAFIAIGIPVVAVWGSSDGNAPTTVRPEPPTLKRPQGIGAEGGDEGGKRVPVTVANPRVGTVMTDDIVVTPSDFDIARPLAGVGPKVSLPGEQPGALALTGWTERSSFAGLTLADITAANAGGGWPPDPTIAVGRTGGNTRVIEWVNTGFTIMDGSGTVLTGPLKGSAVWTGFGGVCETSNAGDPLVRYDQWAQRWVMSQFAFATSGGNPVSPYYQCIAVSTTSDPQGTWARWSYEWNGDFPDYGKIGMTPEGYFITLNMFPDDPLADVHSGVLAFDRQALLNADAGATGIYTSLDGTYFGILPADPEGAQPASTDGLPMAMLDSRMWNTGQSSRITLLRANPDFGAGTMPVTVTQQVAVSPSYIACLGSNGSSAGCIPQPGSTTAGDTSSPKYLDSLGDRLMYRLAWRRVGAEERLAVAYTGSPNIHPADITAARPTQVRWVLLARPADGRWVLDDSGATATAASGATADFRWMPSVALDSSGGMVMVYGAANHDTTYASMRISGHTPNNGAGTESGGGLKAEATVKAGVAVQRNYKRWGDYFTAISDPVTACRVWAVGEFMAADPGTRPNNWGTWITEVEDADCAGRPVPQTLPGVPARPRVDFAATVTAPTFTSIGGSPVTPTVTYQWLRCTDTASSVDCAPIADATSSAYTPAAGDLGKVLRVRATATAGGGEMQTALSAPSGTVVSTMTPDPPSGIAATATHPTIASVTFSPPADDGGLAIGSFLATCTSADGGTTSSGSDFAGPVTVLGLTPSRTYTCSVRARNSLGYSQESAASAAFTTPAEPAPVVAPTAASDPPPPGTSTPEVPTPPAVPIVSARTGGVVTAARLANAARIPRPAGSRTTLRVASGPRGGLRITRTGIRAGKAGTYRVTVTVITRAGKRTTRTVGVLVR